MPSNRISLSEVYTILAKEKDLDGLSIEDKASNKSNLCMFFFISFPIIDFEYRLW